MSNPAELNDSQKPLELLKKSSLDVKRERKIEVVSWLEIENILFQFNQPSTTWGEIYKQIGLSSRSFHDDHNKNQARKVTKYALLGLLAEQNNNHEFTFDELGILLGALINHLKDRAEPYKKEIFDLQKVVMKLMLEK